MRNRIAAARANGGAGLWAVLMVGKEGLQQQAPMLLTPPFRSKWPDEVYCPRQTMTKRRFNIYGLTTISAWAKERSRGGGVGPFR